MVPEKTVSERLVLLEKIVGTTDPLGKIHSTVGGGNPVVVQLSKNEPSNLGTAETATVGSPVNVQYTEYRGVLCMLMILTKG